MIDFECGNTFSKRKEKQHGEYKLIIQILYDITFVGQKHGVGQIENLLEAWNMSN